MVGASRPSLPAQGVKAGGEIFALEEGYRRIWSIQTSRDEKQTAWASLQDPPRSPRGGSPAGSPYSWGEDTAVSAGYKHQVLQVHDPSGRACDHGPR